MTVARSLVVVGALLALVALTAHADIHNLPTKWVNTASSTAPQLSTKNVVLSPALGWLTCSGSTGGYRSTGSSYFSQESLLQDLYTNEISIRYVQEYLANAGASVHSTRERWFETPTEVIINDFDTAAAKKVTYTGGTWSSATSVLGYGSDQHWFAAAATETATATFTATISTDGYYPVYMTSPALNSNRGSPDVRITHSGGIQTLSVPQYQQGAIFVYLGRYYFTAAAGIKVEITNKMPVYSGKSAMVDAVRVGCGASTAGIPRWKLSAQDFLYFQSQNQNAGSGLQIAANGAPTIDTDYNARATFSNFMYNQKVDMDLVNRQNGADWLYAGIGASGGAGSGVSTVTPNTNPSGLSATLYTACSTAATSVRVNVQQATGQNNQGGSLDASKTELTQNTNMPSFITYTIDVFNGTEMALMAKESFRETLGRAIYKGIHKYFVPSSPTIIPLPVTNLYSTVRTGNICLCWVQPTDPLESSAVASVYKLYTSTDGRGWDAGVIFGSSSLVVIEGNYGNSICGNTQNVAVDTQYYFKVAGVNAGGEALTKLTAAGYRYTGARPRVVVIDAFDADFIHTSDNIEGRYTREYVYEYVSALQAAGYRCETATKNSLLDTTWVADYFMNFDTVIWFAGENTGINVLPAAHQAVINTWIAAANITKPRSLVVSGSHVASGLAAAGGASATFLANNLGAGYAGSTASAPFVARQAVDPGFTMSGTVTFNSVIALGNPYLVQTPDILTTVGNGMAALYYGASSGTNIAGVSTVGGSYSSFLLAMPFETIKSSTERTTLMTSIVKSVIQRRASSAISAATASAATIVSTSRASVASQLSAASASAMSSSVASFASKASVASQLSAASASAISTSVASFASVASVASVSSDAFVASTSIAFVTSAASVATASVASVASDASAASTSIEFVTSAASVATASAASVASDASAASTSIEFVTSAASVATASVASVASDASAASTSIEFVTSAASVATASVASVASDASIASTSVEFVTSAASVATVSAASIASDAYVASTSIAFVTSVTSAAVASSTKASVASVASTAFAHSTSSSHSASTSKATAHFASTSSAHITTADVSASGASISSAATTVPASLATIASSAASPASASLEPANASSFPIGPVVGGVVGGLILLILVVILLVTLLRRRRNTKKEQGPGSVERNSLPDPVADDSVGTFANPLFQQMDDNLGDASTPAADSQLAASKLEESGLRE